jgi:hypothetical protein
MPLSGETYHELHKPALCDDTIVAHDWENSFEEVPAGKGPGVSGAQWGQVPAWKGAELRNAFIYSLEPLGLKL